MTCPNCHTSTNLFPTCPEVFSDYPGWCLSCIHEDTTERFKYMQANGFFLKLRDLMSEGLEAGEFESRKRELLKECS
jgi:hypothetical protein